MAKKTLNDLYSMQDIYKIAIKREKEAREFYLKARERARTPAEEKLFQQLADEEKSHMDNLQSRLDDIEAQIETDKALSFDIY